MPSDETQSTNPIEPRRRRISADSFRTGRNIANIAQQQQANINVSGKLVQNIVNLEKRVNNTERKISIIRNILGYQKSDLSENLAAVSPQALLMRNLDAILETLRKEKQLEDKENEKNRKRDEYKRRNLQENRLEKRISVLKDTTKKVVAPVQNILDNILKAFIALVTGKFLLALIKYISDPKNQQKIRSLIRFFSDNGPKLLAAFLLFGTSFGRAAVKLTGLLARGAVRLGAATMMLLKRLGLKSAGRLATSLLGGKGRLIGRGLQLAATAGGFIALENLFSGGEGESQAFKGGGLFFSDGLVDGPYGSDQVNARLTDGEFVMSAPAVAAIGPSVLERINERYGGTNKPRVVDNTLMAQGGGLIGGITDALSFLPNTGNVMAPMASQGMYQDEGTVLSKILGVPIPGSLRMEGYSDEDVSRYNRADTGDPTRFLEQFKSIDNRFSPETQTYFKEKGLGALTSPAVRSRRRAAPAKPVTPPTQMSESDRNKKFIGESFRNLPQNIKIIKGAAERQREMLNEIMPGRFEGSMNLRGTPIRTPKATIPKQSSSLSIPQPPQRGKPNVVVMDGGTNVIGGDAPSIPSNPKLPAIPICPQSSNKADVCGYRRIR